MRHQLICMLTLIAALGSGWTNDLAAQELTFELESTRDVAYYAGADADPILHKLDIHRPRGCKGYPVVFFVHGGSWIHGDKDHFGIYSTIARALARHGIGMVSINYRLSPKIQHPEHIRDVARAFAWTQRNIARYGGDPEHLFVSGHSAGGHLSALLATDETYLKAEGLSLQHIKGAMPISGVYVIPKLGLFDAVFGNDPAMRKQASPVSHASERAPPFLILYGDKDLPSCDRPGAEALCKALKEKQCPAQVFEIGPRNHISILLSACRDSDPVMRHMLCFIDSQLVTESLCAGDCARALDAMGQNISRYAAAVGR